MQKIICLFEKYLSLLRWALVGVSTAFIDFILFITLYPVIPSILVANFFAGLVSLSFNYYAHYFWSFNSKSAHIKSGLKYLINLITFWSISTVLLKILISYGLDPKIAKILPIPIVAPLSFISLKIFVFKNTNYFK